MSIFQRVVGRKEKASLLEAAIAKIQKLTGVPDGVPVKFLGIDEHNHLVKADGTGEGGGITLPINVDLELGSNEAAIDIYPTTGTGYVTYPKLFTANAQTWTGDNVGQPIGIEITGMNNTGGGGHNLPFVFKDGATISTTHIVNQEQNYLTLSTQYGLIFGGVFDWFTTGGFEFKGGIRMNYAENEISFHNPTSTRITNLRANHSVGNTLFVLPSTNGTNGQVLTTDGSGNTSWNTITAEVADNSITTAKIQDGAVVNGKLGVGAVGTPEIAGNAVTETKIANNSISNSKIQNEAVTLPKLLATGAAAGRVLQTDGINMSWVVPSSGPAHKVGDLTWQFAMAHNNGSIRKDVFDRILTNTELNKYIALSNTTNRQNIFLSLLGGAVRPPMSLPGTSSTTIRGFIGFAAGRLNIFTDGASNGIMQTADFTTFTAVESHNYKRPGIMDGFLAASHAASRVPVWTNHLTNEMIASSGFNPPGGSGLMGITYINPSNVLTECHYTYHTGGLCHHNTHPVCLNGVLSVYNPQLPGRSYSTDNGVTWLPATNSINTQNVSVFNSTTLISNTSGGTTAKYTTDLATWTSMTLPNTSINRENCFATNGSIIVYVGSAGRIFTTTSLSASPTWTERTHNLPVGFPTKVFWCGDIFILMGDENNNNICTSTDGITWTARTIDAAMVKYAVAKVGARYVMWGEGRLTSTLNATSTWTTVSATNMNAVGAVSASQAFSYYATSFIPTSDSVYFISTSNQINRYIASSNTISALTASQQLTDIVGTWNSTSIGITSSSLATRYLE